MKYVIAVIFVINIRLLDGSLLISKNGAFIGQKHLINECGR